jgi:isocitrate/isopropylmalate dehydrogenase
MLTQVAPKERVTATLIPGDGVGPELVTAVEQVFKAAGVPMDFEVFFLSEVHAALSVPMDTVVESINRNGLCLKGRVALSGHEILSFLSVSQRQGRAIRIRNFKLPICVSKAGSRCPDPKF